MTKQAFTFIDLFAGIGGFHYALSEFGGKCVWASEWDKPTAELYKLNHGLKPEGDITKVDEKDIPEFDVLAAGFPCQAFSVSGKQAGFNDARGTLFFDIARIVKHHKPKVLFLENVRNFAKHDDGKTLTVVRTVIESLGYNFYGQLFNAGDFGLPQQRQRFIMVALRKDIDKGKSFVFPVGSKVQISLKDILEPRDASTKALEIKRPDLIVDKSKMLAQPANRTCQIGKVSKGRQGERVYDVNGHAITLSAHGGGIGSKTGLYYVDDVVRKLTPRECARVQGFPESFILPNSNNLAWQVFGNSVPVNVLKSVVEALSKQGFLK